MKPPTIVLGTRGSALALAQANIVRALLRQACPRHEVEIRIIVTTGDRKTTTPLARGNIKGLFTRELEQALLRRKIDLAVHSLKDLPTELPPGLDLGAVPLRSDARDAAVACDPASLAAPRRVLTSSPRRAFQARLLWPGCETVEIRGNVGTRLLKLVKEGPGAVLLAGAAGLRRLDLCAATGDEGLLRHESTLHFRALGVKEMISAPGQGAIGIEIRADDGETRERLRGVNDPSSWFCALAERGFLHAMGGGCAAPMAAHAFCEDKVLRIEAIAARENAATWRGSCRGTLREAEKLGTSLAGDCLASTHGKG